MQQAEPRVGAHADEGGIEITEGVKAKDRGVNGAVYRNVGRAKAAGTFWTVVVGVVEGEAGWGGNDGG